MRISMASKIENIDDFLSQRKAEQSANLLAIFDDRELVNFCIENVTSRQLQKTVKIKSSPGKILLLFILR